MVWVQERLGGQDSGNGVASGSLQRGSAISTNVYRISMALRSSGRKEEKHLRQMDDHGIMP